MKTLTQNFEPKVFLLPNPGDLSLLSFTNRLQGSSGSLAHARYTRYTNFSHYLSALCCKPPRRRHSLPQPPPPPQRRAARRRAYDLRCVRRGVRGEARADPLRPPVRPPLPLRLRGRAAAARCAGVLPVPTDLALPGLLTRRRPPRPRRRWSPAARPRSARTERQRRGEDWSREGRPGVTPAQRD